MPQRTWFKIYADKWLTGTIRQDSVALRAVFVDLLALCAAGPGADEGLIYARPGIGYTDTQLAKIAKVHRRTWLHVAKVLRETDRIEIKSANVIAIINWQKYQSEYTRQKLYRNVTKSNTIERGEGRVENRDTTTTTTTAKNFGEFCRIYEANIGMLSPILAQELDDLAMTYEPAWFEAAVKEAVTMNKRALKYIVAILRRWGVEGFKAPMKRPTGFPPGRPPKSQLPTAKELKQAWALSQKK